MPETPEMKTLPEDQPTRNTRFAILFVYLPWPHKLQTTQTTNKRPRQKLIRTGPRGDNHEQLSRKHTAQNNETRKHDTHR